MGPLRQPGAPPTRKHCWRLSRHRDCELQRSLGRRSSFKLPVRSRRRRASSEPGVASPPRAAGAQPGRRRARQAAREARRGHRGLGSRAPGERLAPGPPGARLGAAGGPGSRRQAAQPPQGLESKFRHKATRALTTKTHFGDDGGSNAAAGRRIWTSLAVAPSPQEQDPELRLPVSSVSCVHAHLGPTKIAASNCELPALHRRTAS